MTAPIDTVTRILASAQAEIDKHGIIGLRTAAVAANAQVSVPLIYKYFNDRDGLLAAVLGNWYENFVTQYRASIDQWIDTSQSITLEEFALLSPKPNGGAMQTDREFRLQVLATALENPQLRVRIKKITQEAHVWVASAIQRGKEKLPTEDQNFDPRIFTLLLFNTMYIFNDLLEAEPIADSDYNTFIVSIIRSSARYRS